MLGCSKSKKFYIIKTCNHVATILFVLDSSKEISKKVLASKADGFFFSETKWYTEKYMHQKLGTYCKIYDKMQNKMNTILCLL